MSWKPIAKFWVPVFGELDLVLVPSGPGIRLNYVKFVVGDPSWADGKWHISGMPNMLFNPYANAWTKEVGTDWLMPVGKGNGKPIASLVATAKGLFPWSIPTEANEIKTNPIEYWEQFRIAKSVAGGKPDTFVMTTGWFPNPQGPKIEAAFWGAGFATKPLILPHSIFGYQSKPKALRLRDDGWLKEGKPQAQDPTKLDYYVKDVSLAYHPLQAKLAFPNPIYQLGQQLPVTANLPKYQAILPGGSTWLALRMGFPVALETLPSSSGGGFAFRARYTTAVFVIEGLF